MHTAHILELQEGTTKGNGQIHELEREVEQLRPEGHTANRQRRQELDYNCESVPFANFAIKAITECGTVTGSSYCSAFRNCFFGKVGRRIPLTKIKSVTVGGRMTRYDLGLGCATSARLLIMRPVAGNSSCLCASRELWQSGGLTSCPGQDSNPRSDLTFVRALRLPTLP